jgi:hypothetical protein
LNAWTNLYETWYVYCGIWAHLNGILHKSLPSVCVFVCIFPPIILTQWLGEHVPVATNTCNNRRIVGRVIFYVVHVISKERLCVCLCIPLSLQGSSLVNTFPWQRRIVWGLVFCAVRVVSKESRCLVLPRTIVIVFSAAKSLRLL